MADLADFVTQNMALIGALVGFAVIAVFGWILTGNNEENDALARRIARVSGGAIATEQTRKSIRAKTYSSSGLERALSSMIPDSDLLQTKIIQAGFSLTPGRLGLICISLFILTVTIQVLVVELSLPLVLPSAFTLSIGLPYVVIKMRAEARLRKFVDYLPDALDLICRGLKAGLPVMESISTVGEELPDPIGGEFRLLQSRVQMGSTLEDGLWDMAKQVPSDELRFLITAISIQRETGGNLAETLGNLSDLLRKRKQFRLKVKAMSSEARASAWIIGSLPFAMFGILSILNPDYLSVLISDPRGIAMSVFGLMMIAVGAFIMMKLVKFEA